MDSREKSSVFLFEKFRNSIKIYSTELLVFLAKNLTSILFKQTLFIGIVSIRFYLINFMA